ncbi:MAG: aminopeptidase [Bacteroidaceae bacterium]|nr:aminopeptidase [Bacteroidaceae bacterium]
MKRLFLLLATLVAIPAWVAAGDDEGYKFTTVKELPITSIKDQNRSGTCWCFSGLAFFESELLRMGKGEYDLCEMFVVHKTMEDRATAAIRTHGDVSYAQGGSFYDVLYCLQHYGIVPETAMPAPGTPYGETAINHNEVDAVATAFVEALAKGKQKKLTPAWKKAFSGIYDAYLGECPTEFVYEGKTYTPQSYTESLGLNLDDYVSLTSYTHHPFYSTFALEIQDNWRWGLSYNLPLDEFVQVFDYAIEHGYPIAWGSDVSETGFTRSGIAVIPDTEAASDLSGSDRDRWLGLTPQQRSNEALSHPSPERVITQEMRQEGYDNWETTDDHGMLIYGIAQDQNDTRYYMVKNSWGSAGTYNGIWYASKTFVAYKTMNILVNKNGIPSEIRTKLGI